MAFADGLSFTPTGGTAITLNRTSFGDLKGGFASEDGLTTLSISHNRTRALTRHLLRFDQEKIVPNPLVATASQWSAVSAYLVIQQPSFGYTADEAVKFAGGLATFATQANLKKLLGNES